MTVTSPRYSERLRELRGWQDAINQWETGGLVERLWARDASVWEEAAPDAAQWLGWLNLPEAMPTRLEKITRLVEEVVGDGTEDVALMGMGGSSLAPEMLFSVFGSAPGHPRLSVIDSTHPEAVVEIEGRIDPSRTFFVVSSKSGTTVETDSLYRYFWARSGADPRRFAAVTDRGTPLDRLARERGFRAVFNAPADVGGRFSAFSEFGIVPAALIGVDVVALLSKAAEMAEKGRAGVSDNPAIGLGLAWAVAALAGMDKLTLHTSPSLEAFTAWMEQLVAESLGKRGRGIIPVGGEAILSESQYSPDRLHSVWELEGDHERKPNWGDVHIGLADRLDLGAEILRAELAVAAAGAVLGVNPFDQPDVEEAKRLASQAMSKLTTGPDADLVDVQSAAARETIVGLMEGMQPGGYLGLQAYLPPDPRIESVILEFRRQVTARSGVPTTFGYGPRYLHSVGQVHKGGPPGGVFLQLLDEPSGDVAIPGVGYGFSKLIAAQAEGDYFALRKAGRRVVRISVGADRLGGLEALADALV